MSDMQWPSPIMTPKPTILVNSIEDAAFSENLLSLKVAEEATGGMHVEATLNNWGTVKGVLGFLFSESGNFILGNPFEVKVQGASLFTGLIIRLAESSSPGLPPQLNLEAQNFPRTKPRGRAARARKNHWTLNLFKTAREWTVSLDSNTELSRGPVEVKPVGFTGQVLAELNAGLHPKDAILLNGLGSKFQGDYLVTGVTHWWDLQKGFRTEFTVERGKSR